VGCDNQGTVLFTGYYTPVFEASVTPTSDYRWPLYRLPPDLVKGSEGECLGRRLSDGSLAPYYTRAEIDAGVLDGHELVYLKDPFEAYVCSVQGSARLRLPEGEWLGVGYDGNNGKPYTSVGRILVEDGLISSEKLSLSNMIEFFKQNPDKLAEYLPRNARYVFFRRAEGPPTGSLGMPVTPRRSLATDKRIFPRGCLTFVDTKMPGPEVAGERAEAPFQQFMLDQDTGGAIRAPGRADIYVGVGDEAGRIAGWTFCEGGLFYLFLKDEG
jgi:membrane-bound lytic murein transglycosylase A